jgi:ribosomal protein L23
MFMLLNVKLLNMRVKRKHNSEKAEDLSGKLQNVKKAVVTLKKGETIELFEQVYRL